MYPISELAALVPLASESEQRALTLDIADKGQKEAAVLWKGEIVDGRCRQLACTSLGVELLVKELDEELSEEQVRRLVKSMNTRRNLTVTQKVVSAHKEYLAKQGTLDEVAASWGVSRKSLVNCNYIAKHRGELIEPLFDGKTVVVYDIRRGVNVTTNKISTLAKLVKQLQEKEVVLDSSKEVEFCVEGMIDTEKGKEWYYSTVAAHGVRDWNVRSLLVELANYKYSSIS